MMDNIRFSEMALAAQDLIVVPEPATFALAGFGFLGLLMARRRAWNELTVCE